MIEAWSPYPGLRPFQPDDSEYFYGRDQQVDEIVARLREKRFVAVIGGSGSGKSSLVLAGAIARLRSFAIKDAGDFWAPVIATPGTNHVGADTPIRRLARKFCGELAEVPDPAARLDACTQLLRLPNGLGELVEQFGAQLKGSDSVSLDRLQVNFLFLLDQFEELFHPSNAPAPIAADCKHLVDRIVEQFKHPHRQVCVAITMRSEHLNDCPRYEALPDAINAASYLVKRLDADQLADAIEQPVLRYLRKHVAEERAARRQARLQGRGVAPSAPLPDQIPIDAALIARLIADSKAVLAQQDHADHLPLLQHLLFWIWHQASERCDGHALVDAITLDDLWQAVGVMPGAVVQPLDASVNVLQACLENRCEAIFCGHLGEQEVWEAVFRSLAFKDPNTGTYTQQRASMAELRLRLGLGSDDNAALAAHLQPWLAPHGYLHWDIDSRTVKVAHETLIRRWERLRQWIDEEDLQFHVYLRLLEDCERWSRATNPEWRLSGGDTLRRYEDARLQTALQDPAWLARISRLLAMDRDGQRLGAVAADAPRFLQLSLSQRTEREAERRHAEQRQRDDEAQLAQAKRNNDVIAAENLVLQARAEAEAASNAALASRAAAAKEKSGRLRWRMWLAFTLVFALLPLMAWVWELARAEQLLADKERTLHRSYALAAESQVGFQPQFKDFGGPQGLLRYALIGTDFFAQGRQKGVGPAQSWLLRDYYSERLDALDNTERFSESRNTSSLRTIVQGGVWLVPAAAASAPAATPARPCLSMQLEEGGAELKGKDGVFYPRQGATDRAGLVVAVAPPDPYNPFPIKSISVGRIGGEGRCLVGQQLLATPQQQRARVGIAADASNVVIAFDYFTQFYTVMWDDPGGVHTRPRATVSSAVDFPEGSLPTRSNRFWTDVALGAVNVRLFDVEASTIDDGVARQGAPMQLLAAGAKASACRRFAEQHKIDSASEDVWALEPVNDRSASSSSGEARSHCLRIGSLRNNTGQTFYSASLYALGAVASGTGPDQDLPLIDQLTLGEGKPVEVRLDERAGWLAFHSEGGPWRAVPWSLPAFGEMARGVFQTVGGDAEHRGGCGRVDDDPQFNLPYNLILGDMKCPSDAALKGRSAAVSPTPRP